MKTTIKVLAASVAIVASGFAFAQQQAPQQFNGPQGAQQYGAPGYAYGPGPGYYNNGYNNGYGNGNGYGDGYGRGYGRGNGNARGNGRANGNFGFNMGGNMDGNGSGYGNGDNRYDGGGYGRGNGNSYNHNQPYLAGWWMDNKRGKLVVPLPLRLTIS